MRTSDIAYVKQGSVSSPPPPPLEEMSLKEIVRYYLSTCVKSNGLVSVCMKCNPKCVYGERAIELATGMAFPGPSTTQPYVGSYLQKARAENEFRKQCQAKIDSLNDQIKETETKLEKAEEKANEEKKKKKRCENWKVWFEESLKSEDQVQWVMDRFGLTKTQAKKKIYNIKFLYQEAKDLDEKYHKVKMDETPQKVEVKEETKTESDVSEKVHDDSYLEKAMERKLESLMNQQELLEAELKKLHEEYEQKIKEPQDRLKKIREQIDTICKTMDIFKTD